MPAPTARNVFIQFSRLGPRHRDRRLRGARAHRRDPRRAAGRLPALLRAEVLAPATRRCCACAWPATRRPHQRVRPDRPQLKRRLERMPGVARVEISGAPPQEVEIAIDPTASPRTASSLNELAARLQAVNFSISAGQITTAASACACSRSARCRPAANCATWWSTTTACACATSPTSRCRPQRMDYGRRLDGRPAVGIDIFRSATPTWWRCRGRCMAELRGHRRRRRDSRHPAQHDRRPGRGVTSSLDGTGRSRA